MRPLLATIFVAALIFTLVMAWLPHPPGLPIEESDKFWHVVAFATLSFLAGFAFPALPMVRIGERLSFLGALVELVQNVPALHRDCDIMDWIVDTIAIAVALAVVAWINHLRARGTAI